MDTKTKDVEEWVPPPLDICDLELQSSFFKIIMISSAQVAMPFLWLRMQCLDFGVSFLAMHTSQQSSPSSSKLLRLLIYKCERWENIQLLIVFEEQVEELARNPLDMVVGMFMQDFYTLNTIPYQVAISDWKAQKVWYGEGE